MSIPCGTIDGLPVGLMLIGRHYDELDDLRAASRLRAGSRLASNVNDALWLLHSRGDVGTAEPLPAEISARKPARRHREPVFEILVIDARDRDAAVASQSTWLRGIRSDILGMRMTPWHSENPLGRMVLPKGQKKNLDRKSKNELR